jgi:hypothetical protein
MPKFVAFIFGDELFSLHFAALKTEDEGDFPFQKSVFIRAIRG